MGDYVVGGKEAEVKFNKNTQSQMSAATNILKTDGNRFVYLYLCIHIYTYTYVFVYLYLCVCICVLVFVFVYMYLCICIVFVSFLINSL